MKTYIQEYFKNKQNAIKGSELWDEIEPLQKGGFVLMKRIKCKDNFTMSIQASQGHYCLPRETLMSSVIFHYTNLEVGYPSKKEELLLKYADDKNKPKKTVYGYVPVEIINKVIEKHGGLI